MSELVAPYGQLLSSYDCLEAKNKDNQTCSALLSCE